MAINKKLIHFKKREYFDREVANGNVQDHSICFIQDTKEIWTHGQFYSGNVDSLIANVQAVDTGDVLDDVSVDYATKTYVDGLVGDINSILEEIINGGPALITFTVDGTECQAEEGMTFYEWAISDYYNKNVNMYNYHNTTISIREYCLNNGDTGCALGTSSGIPYSGITTSTVIQDGEEYVPNSGGFPI